VLVTILLVLVARRLELVLITVLALQRPLGSRARAILRKIGPGAEIRSDARL